MSSILKVDTIQDQSGNNIISEAANVITIGASGDTITVPAGATVSGFTSAGIDDNATSTAITISSDEDVTFTEDILLGDNKKAKFGTGNDLEIFHDGSNSNISDVGTGGLILRTDGTQIALNKGSSENMAKFITDGAVELYYDNSKKFETTTGGATITGTATVTGDLTVDTNTLKVDSSNNRVGINNASPSNTLDVNDSAGAVIKITRDSQSSYLQLSTDGSSGQVFSGAGALKFKTGSSEAGRFDTSGNLLVGKTDQTANVSGTEIEGSGTIVSTRDNNTNMFLNRKTSDGQIINFRKDNSVVGSIGTASGKLNLGTENCQIRFRDDLVAVIPANSDGSNSDNDLDLGYSTVRWRRLYLSEGVFLGGTGTANKLDDYEEGTWTPAFNAGSAGTALTGTVAYSYYNRGYYTKIGRAVSVNFHAVLSNKGTGSGDMWLAGSSLPFASSGVYVASMYQPIFMTKSGQNTYTGVLYGTFDATGGMRVGLYNANANISFVQHSAIGNDFTVSGLFTYYV